MDFEFFIQQNEDQISVGDEIALYSDDDAMPSGRWKIAGLDVDPNNGAVATIVGMGHLSGHVALLQIDAHDD